MDHQENQGNTDDEPQYQDVLRGFSGSVSHSISLALTALGTSTPQNRLQALLDLQRLSNQVIEDRISATRVELRDICIAQSPLLSLSNELLMKIARFLDEVSLLSLEDCTNPIYSIPTRGVQFAKASWTAQRYEKQLLLLQQNIQSQPRRHRRRPRVHTLTCPNHQSCYTRQNYVEDFEDFFNNPTTAGVPPVEFFLRITYRVPSNNDTTVLLEGFQSNFESLRQVSDAQDQGFQTYIGFIHDRARTVMVRNDLNSLQEYMGFDDRYLQMDSDDSELESDEEAEFHFLQWPETARREFLGRVTLTLLRCSMAEDHSLEQPKVVGSTTGYQSSDQHFAMFRPLAWKIAHNNNDDNASDDTERQGNTSANEEEDHEEENVPVVKMGLGCGGGSSLHLVIKW
ncbi:expressed unknown protein [Seminavis robusta]|uniref:Uncharacterized protein n=1 Tax=Seminavis robusta TaxID=568900 RepID=A0A9N8EEU5_9STRA|nr:expressed unknown protein [Seminavis robusta]|eukprot:Sro972_g226620.1 n/a (399) ;mRNA; f:26331-27625